MERVRPSRSFITVGQPTAAVVHECSPAAATTVTAVALRWGFVEFGRFSAQYRQRYGEVPSETLRRARRESQRPASAST